MKNKRKGALGEKIAREDYESNGYGVISTRFGSDFIVYKKIRNKLYQEYIEVKTGRSRQSATQRKKMRMVQRMGIDYTIYRITEKFITNYSDMLGEKSTIQLIQNEKLYSLPGVQ